MMSLCNVRGLGCCVPKPTPRARFNASLEIKPKPLTPRLSPESLKPHRDITSPDAAARLIRITPTGRAGSIQVSRRLILVDGHFFIGENAKAGGSILPLEFQH